MGIVMLVKKGGGPRHDRLVAALGLRQHPQHHIAAAVADKMQKRIGGMFGQAQGVQGMVAGRPPGPEWC